MLIEMPLYLSLFSYISNISDFCLPNELASITIELYGLSIDCSLECLTCVFNSLILLYDVFSSSALLYVLPMILSSYFVYGESSGSLPASLPFSDIGLPILAWWFYT